MVFIPTYLYIKQHSVTGKLYFGKTSTKNPEKYYGSGVHWKNHIKKHGKEHVVTLWYGLFSLKDELVKFALEFSNKMNIVESTQWLNLKPENGLDGGFAPKFWLGKSRTIDNKKNSSIALTGYKKSTEHCNNISKALLGKPSGRKPNENKISITNGIDMKYILNTLEIPIGWYKGKPEAVYLKNKNRIWINNGTISRMILKNEIIPTGWILGRTKLNT